MTEKAASPLFGEARRNEPGISGEPSKKKTALKEDAATGLRCIGETAGQTISRGCTR